MKCDKCGYSDNGSGDWAHVCGPVMTQFDADCLQMHGKVLTGEKAHYCPEFDYLPIDETRHEFQYCTCEWSKE
jgi:hypothetical protein